MITDTLPEAPPVPKRRSHLLLHCGAHAATLDEVARTPTPARTRTWQPIDHLRLIQVVQRALHEQGLVVAEQAHALTHDGQRYFGLVEIQANNGYSDYRWILGIRNSHDKRLPAGLVAGTQVIVCDNLAFHGSIKLSRKHTRFIIRDLPDLAREAVAGVQSAWNAQDHRIEAYKRSRLRDRSAHDLIIRAVDHGVIANRLVPGVLQEWREPSHDAFTPRTVWSLHNAFTEAMKGVNLERLPMHTQRLTELLDAHSGVN